MSDLDNVLIAAAACELHPKAVLKGIETESVKDRLRAATEEAIALGVEGHPHGRGRATSSSGATTASRRRCGPPGGLILRPACAGAE